MATECYRQCTLTKGTTSQVAWIPEAFAVFGRYVRIRDDDGWMVASAGPRKSGEYILNHERDYLIQREASDI